MTAEEIRALPADNTNATDQALLREIAAQLAEHNEREHRIETRMAIKFARMPDPPAPPGARPGEVVKLEGDIFLEVCSCGLMHEGNQGELRATWEAQQPKDGKPQ